MTTARTAACLGPLALAPSIALTSARQQPAPAAPARRPLARVVTGLADVAPAGR